MARMRMVTRTVKTSECVVVGMNTDTYEVETKVVLLTTEHSEDSALKAIKKMDFGAWAAVKVLEVKIVEKLYGMPETEFLKYAEELPPRYSAEDNKIC